MQVNMDREVKHKYNVKQVADYDGVINIVDVIDMVNYILAGGGGE